MNNELRYQNKYFENIRANSSLIKQEVRRGSDKNQTSNIILSMQCQQEEARLRAKEEKWERIREDVRKQYLENKNKSGQESLIIYLVFLLVLLATLYYAPQQFYVPKAPTSDE